MRPAPIVLVALVFGGGAGAARGAPIIGGSDAPAGMWPDAAAVLFPEAGSDTPECSGTLIAPTVVLTAGHCATRAEPPLPDHVRLATTSIATPELGETLAVGSVIEYPDSAATIDLGVLVLTTASSVAPRAVATGWARVDIADGAAVAIVGYGATDADATTTTTTLQEASTSITDAGCTTSAGCRAAAQPDGELGAGGDGVDTCPGDSGGPLYLVTSYGTFLAGVTSRAYAGEAHACGGGGIYARPDKVIAWIEAAAGVPVARGPEPALDGALVVTASDGAEATIVPNDPIGSAHAFAIAAQPAHGRAVVRADGRLRVCSSAGSDRVTVTVTDAAAGARSVDQVFQVFAVTGGSDAGCDPDAFDDGDDPATGGCCAAGGGGGAGSALLAAGVLALVRRRR